MGLNTGKSSGVIDTCGYIGICTSISFSMYLVCVNPAQGYIHPHVIHKLYLFVVDNEDFPVDRPSALFR